jgi:hypothetical protein
MWTVLIRMYIGDLDIYPIIISGVPIHFWFILCRLYHPFRFILNQTSHHIWHGALTHIENISLFYIEKDQQFKYPWRLNLVLLFFIFIGETKNNRLDERVTCECPVKCSHGCSDDTRLQGWKKENTLGQKRKKSKMDKKDDIIIVLFFFSIFLIILFGLPS